MKISELFDRYADEVIYETGQSERTLEMHNLALKTIVRYCGDLEIEEFDFRKYQMWRRKLERNCGINTVRGYVLKLRLVLRFGKLIGLRILDSERVKVPKRQNKVVGFITPAEVELFIGEAKRPRAGFSKFNRLRNALIVSFLYASGVRVSELCKIDVLDIREDGSFTIVGKRGKVRLCFIDERTQILMKEYLQVRNDNIQALFISEKTGARISKNTVEEIFRTIRKNCNFAKPLTPHIMRHSFATNLLANNTNLIHIRDFLGHESVQTTEIYTHVVNTELAKIYKEKHTI